MATRIVPDDLFYYSNRIELMERLLWADAMDAAKLYREEVILSNIGWMYQGDFYGLLKHLGVNKEFWVLSAYLNGLRTPFDFDGSLQTIKIATDTRFRNRTQDIGLI